MNRVETSVSHQSVSLSRWEGACHRDCVDSVAVEEPLEIRINGESVVVTMRTPGDDFALAAGFLFAEAIIRDEAEIEALTYCDSEETGERGNILNVRLDPDWREGRASERWDRHFTATSSCGLCGKASIEGVRCLAPPLPRGDFTVESNVIQELPERLRAAQQVFEETGGLHAAGLFDGFGTLLDVREDVGRHNALDKLIGAALLDGTIPLHSRLLLVSGRTSFEILQKSAMAALPIVCAVSAPSSLAVQLAEEMGITLVGFLRHHRMNVYTYPDRIVPAGR